MTPTKLRELLEAVRAQDLEVAASA